MNDLRVISKLEVVEFVRHILATYKGLPKKCRKELEHAVNYWEMVR